MLANEAVVISLPGRRDRLDAFYASLPSGWPFPQPQLHPGVTEQPAAFWQSSAGAWGCRQAHLQILQSAWDRGVGATLVLEDDAEFTPAFTTHWKGLGTAPPAWSMLMLGGQHIQLPQPAGQHWVRCRDTRRTHAYIIRLKAIPELLRTWTRTRRHIDHALADFQARTKVFAPATFLIGQRAGWSDISSKANSQRFWNESL